MLDLNLSPIDVEDETCDANDVFQPGSNVDRHEIGSVPTSTIPDVEEAPSVPTVDDVEEAPSVPTADDVEEAPSVPTAEPTVSTAATSSAAPDVEEGIEVMSTPTEPQVGMTFDTFKAAQKYYNAYARCKGFGTRIDSSKSTKKANGKSKYIFVCHKAGVNNKGKIATDGPVAEKKVVSQRQRGHVQRTRCPARMIVKITSNGLWEVVTFVSHHNHELVEKFSLTKYLNSHRRIPQEEKLFIKTLHDCSIKTTRAYQIMAELYGGVENVPYTKTDCKNLRKSYGAENEGRDMKATFDFFDELKKEDPDFFYDFTLDEEGRVEHIFWVDGEARRMFSLYGDCVSFDTTYCTNKYNMPCAHFIGINRHGQSVQLGCGFLRNEKTESFKWLFETFKRAMGGSPTCIITDQDAVMAAAIRTVFTETIHRNCRWHIMENARKRLGAFLTGKEDLCGDFNDCIDNSYTIEEFEDKWQAMIEKHNLLGDDRFDNLYKIRAYWMPVFFMKYFFPFLQTTQRSEGFNAVLKRYVSPQNSLLNFVKQYRKIQKEVLTTEIENEATTTIKNPSLVTRHPMEAQMSTIYTRKLFNVFQIELQNCSSYYIVDVVPHCKFDLVPYEKDLGRTFRVTADKEHEMYRCTCCKFERDGILCAHILKVFDRLAIRHVPQRYIKARWSKEDQHNEQINNIRKVQVEELTAHEKRCMRYFGVCGRFADFARPSLDDDEEYKLIMKHFNIMQTEVLELRKRKASNISQTAQGSIHTEQEQGGSGTSSRQINSEKSKKHCNSDPGHRSQHQYGTNDVECVY